LVTANLWFFGGIILIALLDVLVPHELPLITWEQTEE